FKNEIEEYANEKKISFREDQSNLKTDYDRNKIRLDVIPVMKKHFPSFKENFAENIAKWKGAENLYTEALMRVKKKISERRNEEEWISIPALKANASY